MKKLTTLALGLGLALGSVAFAQDSTSSGTMAPADSTTKSTKKTKKTKKSKKPASTDTSSTSTDKKM